MSQLYANVPFTGLIPVEPVRRIHPDPKSPGPVKYEVRVTGTVRTYKKGDI